MSKENTCYICGSADAEKCPDCNLRSCQNHKYMHGHVPEKMNAVYLGPPMWEGKPVATIVPIPDVIREPLSESLNSYHVLLKDKIHALQVFSRESSNMVKNYLKSKKEKFDNEVNTTLNEDEKKEYYVNLSIGIVSGSGYAIKNPKIARLIAKETVMYAQREHIKRASKETVLVYLVVIFEEFLSNLLSAVFSKRQELLKESGKSILYKDVVDYADIYELVKTMSKEAAKDMVESSIEDLGDKLERKFHLHLDKGDDWPKFKEFFYRRNIVVHNYGVPDNTYIEKTKFKGDKNQWLEIDNTYLDDAFGIFEKYANKIADFFLQKYPDEPNT